MLAQLTVENEGIVLVGSKAVDPSSIIATLSNKSVSEVSKISVSDSLTLKNIAYYDTTATLNVFGKKYISDIDAHLSFGNGSVSVGSRDKSGMLWLYGSKALKYEAGENNPIFYYLSGRNFKFYTDVQTSGVFIDSDLRLKTNVTSINEDDYSHLLDITPISYNLTEETSNSQRQRYGFAAQEIKEFYPDLVSMDENGYLSVDYIGFIPLLVEKIKDLQFTIDNQQEIINSLFSENVDNNINKLGVAGIAQTKVDVAVAKVYQNNPNPFNVSTEIAFDLPDNISNAFLCIYDMQGKQLKKMSISSRGHSYIELAAETLSAGMYIYTLIADGVEVGTKRMILTD
jgi:hypothetical protein